MSIVNAEYGDAVDVQVRGPGNPGIWLDVHRGKRPGNDVTYFTIGQAENLLDELRKALQEARGDR